MSRPRAPTAMRRPISRVRSVTDTSMMFMMPMPPTRSETDAIAARSIVMMRADSSWAANISARTRTWKSSSWPAWSRWRCRRMARICSSASAMRSASRTRTEIWPDRAGIGPVRAQHLLLGGGERDQDQVVLVLAERGLALRLEDADDRERDLLDPDRLADGIGVPEQAVPDRVPEDGDLRRAVHVLGLEHPAARDAPLARLDVVGGDALDDRRPVEVAEDRLRRARAPTAPRPPRRSPRGRSPARPPRSASAGSRGP